MARLLISGILLLFIALSAIRIISHNLSKFYLENALDGDELAVERSLAWRPQNSKALYLEAKNLLESKGEESLRLLRLSLASNPADMRVLAHYAEALDPDKSSDSEQLMTLVSELMPANKSLRLRAAAFWLKRGRLDLSIQEWSFALSIDPQLGQQLFPVFLRIAENESARALLADLIKSPPSWWGDFFTYLSNNANDASVLMHIADIREATGDALPEADRISLVQRLMKDENWVKAYLTWVDGLSTDQRKYLAGIYDGGFDADHMDNGFAWRIERSKYFDTRFIHVYDSVGEKSLHIRFTNKEVPYRHIYQYLFLVQGRYHFLALKKTDRLSGRGRVKWVVYCAGGDRRLIGESPAVVQDTKWTLMEFFFTVPKSTDCQAQILRLETQGKTSFDHKLSGNVWFDSLSVTRLPDAGGIQ